MDDKFYHGPAHGGPHFHSGPPGKPGVPGVSPKVEVGEVEDGNIPITVTDGYGQRTTEIPIDSVVTDERLTEKVDAWLDDHPEVTTTVQDGSITVAKFHSSVVDSTLTQSGHPADAAAVGETADELDDRLHMLEEGAPEIISSATQDWLDDHVTPTGSAVIVDNSLTQSGAAADAKVTGDEISDLKSDISDVEVLTGEILLAENADFTSSTVYVADGTTTTLSHRKNTDFISCDKLAYIDFKLRGLTNPDLAIVSWFDQNKTFLRCYSSPTGNSITGRLPVPSDAYYLRGAIVDNAGISYYIKGYYKDSLITKAESIESTINAEQEYENIELITPNYFLYDSTGSLITANSRFSCYPVDVSGYDIIEVKASEYTSPRLNAISFLDDKLVYISGVVSTATTQNTKTAKVPNGAKYAVIPFRNNDSGNYIHGIKTDSLGRRLITVELLTGKETNAVTEIVTPSMTIAEFRTAFNSALSNYATLTGCGIYSFREYTTADNDWDKIYAKINKVFRAEVYVEGMPHETICDRVNHAFTHNIWMWKDAKYNDGTPRDFSLAFADRSGEPSAIVSPDGGTLYVYGYDGRWATNDGLHWSAKETLVRTGAPNNAQPEHANTNYIDGIYYTVGALNDTDRELGLFTSTDGLNFTYRGKVLEKSDITVDGETVMTWGNSYIVKDADTYYLYIEAKLTNNVNFWDIYLCTCSDPLLDNGDGTVGDWTYSGTGAIVTDEISSVDLRAHGNPDIAKGPDNRPIRVNGKWFMYYHVTYNGYMHIYRAYSSDLETWTVDGRIINNRDVPTAGESSAGNADHALIEFKGKTYLFYTWNINSVYTPYIKYVIDDRPFREILKMYP